MEKVKPFLTSTNGVLLGFILVLLSGLLRIMGVLHLAIAFWLGFASCLGLELVAIYYFLLKFEKRTEQKMEKLRNATREHNVKISEEQCETMFSPSEGILGGVSSKLVRHSSAPTPSSTSTPPSSTTTPSSAPSTSSQSVSTPTTTTTTNGNNQISPSNNSTSASESRDKSPLPSHHYSLKSVGHVDEIAPLEGVITIQLIGKKKSRSQYNALLKDGILYYSKRSGMTKQASSSSIQSASPSSSGKSGKDGNSGTSEIKQMALNGAQIRRIEETEIKGMRYAIEILHPERKIIYKIDYLYIILENEVDLERWYFALLTCCVPRNGYIDIELNTKLHDQFKHLWRSQETAHWLSAIWARIHLNMRVSESLRNKMIDKMATRLGEKIEEKQLQDYITNLQITGLDLGSKPPTIESAMILPPDQTGDLVADVWLHYRNGDAHINLECDINLKGWATIPIAFAVECQSLSGKMQLRIPPFPAERFSISFYEEPTMNLVVNMDLGEKPGQVKNMILPKVKELIVNRLKLSLVERYVAPNRKYIRIPTTAKKDPVNDKPLSYNVKTSLKSSPSNAAVTSAATNGISSSSDEMESSSGSSNNFSRATTPASSTESIPIRLNQNPSSSLTAPSGPNSIDMGASDDESSSYASNSPTGSISSLGGVGGSSNSLASELEKLGIQVGKPNRPSPPAEEPGKLSKVKGWLRSFRSDPTSNPPNGSAPQ